MTETILLNIKSLKTLEGVEVEGEEAVVVEGVGVEAVGEAEEEGEEVDGEEVVDTIIPVDDGEDTQAITIMGITDHIFMDMTTCTPMTHATAILNILFLRVILSREKPNIIIA